MRFKALRLCTFLLCLFVTSFIIPSWNPDSSLQAQSSGDRTPLTGWVDMHTHPMAHLGFGGKLIHGAPAAGMTAQGESIIIPIIGHKNDPFKCLNEIPSLNIQTALIDDSATHFGSLACGDAIRTAFISLFEAFNGGEIHHATGETGYPDFKGWPARNDMTHQQMWVDWIKRTHELGNLNVMVALAVNNKTLAEFVTYNANMNDPDRRIFRDDERSGDLQIEQIKVLAELNKSWMEIAYTADDLDRIVSEGKLAIILGYEVDNIGNMQTWSGTQAQQQQWVTNELDELWDLGVRYIFPVHVIDNPLGGTAIYEDPFLLSNLLQIGQTWDIGCADSGSSITHKVSPAIVTLAETINNLLGAVRGGDPFDIAQINSYFDFLEDAGCTGHVNQRGLTPLGEYAIHEMMRMGFMIDVDHMSHATLTDTLAIESPHPSIPYPLNSGHSGPVYINNAENGKTDEQYKMMLERGGMMGFGSTSPENYIQTYQYVANLPATFNPNQLAMGTDANGLVILPNRGAASSILLPSTTGNKTWNYNLMGVAHYGLFADFVSTFPRSGMSTTEFANFNSSTEGFYQMWVKVEQASGQRPLERPPTAHAGGEIFVDSQGQLRRGYPNVDVNTQVRIYGTASSDPDQGWASLIYEWDFDNDGLFDDATDYAPLFTAPATAGEYPVSLRITDNTGLTDVDTVPVIVVDNSIKITLSVSSGDYKEGSSHIIVPTVTNADGAYSVYWGHTNLDEPNDSDLLTAMILGPFPLAQYNLTPTDNGTHSVTAVVEDSQLNRARATILLEIDNVTPTVDLGDDLTINEGSPVTLNGTFTDPGSADTHFVAWYFGDGDYTFGTDQPQHTYTDNGTFEAIMYVVDDDDGFSSDRITVTVNNVAPTVEAGDNITNAVEGNLVRFTPSLGIPGASGESTSRTAASFSDPGNDSHKIEWDFGDGTAPLVFDFENVSPITAKLYPSHTYAENGIYTVRFTVTDNDGGSNSDTLLVTVANALPEGVTASADVTTIDEGGSVNFTGSFSDDGVNDTHSYAWDFDGDGLTDATTLNGSHTYADNGSYTVKFTVTDDDGGSASDTLVITVNNVLPIPSISGATSGLEGTAIALDGSSTDPAGANDTPSYQWAITKNGDAFFSSDQEDINFTLDDNGVYQVTLTVVDEDTLATDVPNTATHVITVDNVAPTPSFVDPLTAGDEGTELAFSATATDPAGANDTITFDWAVEKDGATYTTGSGASFAFTPDDNGSYEIFLTASDEDMAADEPRIPVTTTVTIANVAPQNVDAGSDVTTNEGDAVIFTGSFSDPGSADTHTYAWDFDGDGLTDATTLNASHTYMDNGIFTVTFTVTDDDGESASDTLVITVNNVLPTPSISGATSGLEGTAIALDGSSTDPAGANDTPSYQWAITKNGDAFFSSDQEDINFTPDDNGIYWVTLTVVDEDTLASDVPNTASHLITVDNVAPTPSLVDPLTAGDEGTELAFSAAATDPAGANDTITFDWAVEKDGTAYTTGSGASFAFTPDDNGSYEIFLTASDEDMAADEPRIPVTTTVTVANVAPTANLTQFSPSPTLQGEMIFYEFTAISDPGDVDTAHGFYYSLDCTNDGSLDVTLFDDPINGCHYPDAGVFNVRGRIADKDGDFTDMFLSVTVLDPSETAEYIAEIIRELREYGTINGGQTQALLQKMNHIAELYISGNLESAVQQLEVLQLEIDAFTKAEILTPEQSEMLNTLITRLITSIYASM